MSSGQPKPEKRIIIDEDWKQKVEAEREAIRRGQSDAQSAPEKTPPNGLQPAEPSLEYLINMLALQAMLALGMGPNPVSGRYEINLYQARFFIDLLSVLEEKTKGNRTPAESELLAQALSDLRLSYLNVHKALVAQFGPDFETKLASQKPLKEPS